MWHPNRILRQSKLAIIDDTFVKISTFSILRLFPFSIFTFPTELQLCLCQVKQDFGDKTVALQALLQTLRHILTQIGTFSLQNETHSHLQTHDEANILNIFSGLVLGQNCNQYCKKMLSCVYDHLFPASQYFLLKAHLPVSMFSTRSKFTLKLRNVAA